MGPGLLLSPLYDVLWLLAVLLAVVLPLGLLLWAVLRAATRRVPAVNAAMSRARRHALVVDVVAWTALLAAGLGGAAYVSSRPLDLQQGLLLGLVPAVAGTLFALVHAVGEVTWPRPTGTVRRAALAPRTTADVSPRRLRRALWAWGGGLAVGLVVAGLVADETGRAFPRSGVDWSSASGPFPGWFYGVPLLVAVACVVLAVEATLRLVARRPAVSDADPAWDLALRRLAAHRVLRGGQSVLGVTAAGTLLISATALLNAARGPVVDDVAQPSLGLQVLGFALLALGILSLAVTGLLTALPPDLGRGFPEPSATGVGASAGPSSAADVRLPAPLAPDDRRVDR